MAISSNLNKAIEQISKITLAEKIALLREQNLEFQVGVNYLDSEQLLVTSPIFDNMPKTVHTHIGLIKVNDILDEILNAR